MRTFSSAPSAKIPIEWVFIPILAALVACTAPERTWGTENPTSGGGASGGQSSTGGGGFGGSSAHGGHGTTETGGWGGTTNSTGVEGTGAAGGEGGKSGSTSSGGLGAACTSEGDCASGHCVDGVCCDGACQGTCVACRAALTGEPSGTCSPALVGIDPGSSCADEGKASCGLSGTCDGHGACALYAQGTECAPQLCSQGTKTLASTCDGSGTCQAGGTVACPNSCVGNTCK